MQNFYETRLGLYGDDVRSVAWNTRESQRIRFQVLTEIGHLDGCSILDVGCGLGDLYGFLKEKGLGVEYIGVDLSENMVAQARRNYPDVTFLQGDISTQRGRQYDYVMGSGVHFIDAQEELPITKSLLKDMFALCVKGVSTNFLSRYSPKEDGISYYFSPEEMFSFAMSLTRGVVLRHDYKFNDFTLYLYKESLT